MENGVAFLLVFGCLISMYVFIMHSRETWKEICDSTKTVSRILLRFRTSIVGYCFGFSLLASYLRC